MLNTIFATKREMSQVWTKQGKRMPVTKCRVDDNVILGQQKCLTTDNQDKNFTQKPALILEIGYGKKKLKNTSKPLRTIIKQSGFSFGVKQVRGVKMPLKDDAESNTFKNGDILDLNQILKVGDVVKVQGVSKGHGFAGVVKRYGMRGGPKTRGQSDRHRAVGSIGGQTPGKVWKGKRMPGHYGVENTTVANLTVVHIDFETKEVWLSGPIPGHINSIVRITNTGLTKDFELDEAASGIKSKIESKPTGEQSSEVKETKSVEKEETKSESKAQEKEKEKEKEKVEKKVEEKKEVKQNKEEEKEAKK
jgi:large subunit ribosomal protein L3